jgi:hypothetical protein
MPLPRLPENTLLAQLAGSATVRVDWELVTLSVKHPLDADYVYFPCAGLIILRDSLSGLQAAIVGNRGSTGLYLRRGLHAAVLFGGRAWRVRRSELHEAAQASRVVDELLLVDNDHLVQQMILALQGAAKDDIKQRLAAWLLAVRHHCGTDILQVTHDDLAHLLGVRRPTVTLALHSLEASGAVRSSRGRLIVCDAEKLSRYGAVPPDSLRPILRLAPPGTGPAAQHGHEQSRHSREDRGF